MSFLNNDDHSVIKQRHLNHVISLRTTYTNNYMILENILTSKIKTAKIDIQTLVGKFLIQK